VSNLGGYQWMTTVAKKVGGPWKFIGLVMSAGAVVGVASVKGFEFVVNKCIESIKMRRNIETQKKQVDGKIYTIISSGESNEGLKFNIGDQFRVLEVDEDAVLIEKIGDSDNPYFVALDLIQSISDYRMEDED